MLAIRRTPTLAGAFRSPVRITSNRCLDISYNTGPQAPTGVRHIGTGASFDGGFLGEETTEKSAPNPFTLPAYPHRPRKENNLIELREPDLHKIDIKATSNNTLAVFSHGSKVIGCASGGSVGFKHTQRSTYEAGYQVAKRIIEMVEKRAQSHTIALEIVYNGFGHGREAMAAAIANAEGANIRPFIVRLSDKTPIRIGGPRQPKKRRL